MFLCYRCPVDDKLISRFRGSWSESGVFETQVFAYMKTFRFTGSPALYIECDVRMCHGRCPVSILHVLQHMHITDVTCLAFIYEILGFKLGENTSYCDSEFLCFSIILQGKATNSIFTKTTSIPFLILFSLCFT